MSIYIPSVRGHGYFVNESPIPTNHNYIYWAVFLRQHNEMLYACKFKWFVHFLNSFKCHFP